MLRNGSGPLRQMKSNLILGPYFLGTPQTDVSSAEPTPLGITLEWADSAQAYSIPLSSCHPPHAPRYPRLEHLVFP